MQGKTPTSTDSPLRAIQKMATLDMVSAEKD